MTDQNREDDMRQGGHGGGSGSGSCGQGGGQGKPILDASLGRARKHPARILIGVPNG